jgi:lysozyme family protein
MKENFAASLVKVLAWEGGNDDDPQDHGGRTSRGITQGEYTAWLAEKGLPDADVWKAGDGEIATIYHDEYWEPEGDWLPKGLDYLFFDMKVNSGLHEATLLLQRALRVIPDGRIGPITRQALVKADPKALIVNYSAAKRAFYQSISTHPGQRKFLNGWLNRTASVEQAALAMV